MIRIFEIAMLVWMALGSFFFAGYVSGAKSVECERYDGVIILALPKQAAENEPLFQQLIDMAAVHGGTIYLRGDHYVGNRVAK